MPRTGSSWLDSVCRVPNADEPADGRLDAARVDLPEHRAQLPVGMLRAFRAARTAEPGRLGVFPPVRAAGRAGSGLGRGGAEDGRGNGRRRGHR